MNLVFVESNTFQFASTAHNIVNYHSICLFVFEISVVGCCVKLEFVDIQNKDKQLGTLVLFVRQPSSSSSNKPTKQPNNQVSVSLEKRRFELSFGHNNFG